MGSAFIQRLLNALFNRNKEDDAISKTMDQAKTRNKTAKTANARSKADVKEKLGTETEAEAEERIRSCALEIKSCIDLINNSSTSTPGKSKGSRKRAKVNKSAGNRKASGSRNSDMGTKENKQGVSPAEMVKLLAKAEKKLSKAVVKAKEKDDKKRKEKKKKSI